MAIPWANWNAAISVDVGEPTSVVFSEDFNDCDISDWEVHVQNPPADKFPVDHQTYRAAPCGLMMYSKGEGYAYGLTRELDLDLEEDYQIDFWFMIPDEENHWFLVMDDGYVHVVIDHDVYVDDALMGTAGLLTTNLGRLRVGDIHTGSYDHGSGYWDEIVVTQAPSAAVGEFLPESRGGADGAELAQPEPRGVGVPVLRARCGPRAPGGLRRDRGQGRQAGRRERGRGLAPRDVGCVAAPVRHLLQPAGAGRRRARGEGGCGEVSGRSPLRPVSIRGPSSRLPVR